MTQRTWRDNTQAKKKRAYADLEPEKHAKLKAYCVEHSVGISDLMKALIDRELLEQKVAPRLSP